MGVCAGLFAACTGTPAAPTTRDTLVVWHTQTGPAGVVLQALVDEWNAARLGVRLALERHTPQTMHAAVLNGVARGRLPHLMLATAPMVAAYDAAGALSDLNPLLDAQTGGWTVEERADLYPHMLTAGVNARGRLVGLPQGGSVQVLAFNRDLARTVLGAADRLPSTWDGLTETCGRVSDSARGLACVALESTPVMLDGWAQAHGASLLARGQGGAVVFGLDAPAGRDSMQRLRLYVAQGLASAGLDAAQVREEFAVERTLFALVQSHRLDALRDSVRNAGAFDWSVSRLPLAAGAQARLPYSAMLWVVPKSNPSTEQDARAFLKWLNEPAQTVRYAVRTGELPSRASAVRLAPATLSPQTLETWRTLAPQAQAAPMFAGAPCVDEDLLSGLVLLEEGSRPLDDALQTMRGAVQASLTKDCAVTR